MAELHSETSHVDRELGIAEIDGDIVPIADADSLDGSYDEDNSDSELDSTSEEEIPELTIAIGHLGLVKILEEDKKVGCDCSCASCDMGRHCLSESRGCYL